MLVDIAKREINCKVVFYGPALSGKTTNLRFIFDKLNPVNRGQLVSIDTKGERTLFFDFLPVEINIPGGFKVRFHLYTVPGQFFYRASRRLVLKGADGVVFVADSSDSRMESNLQIFEEMVQSLVEQNNPIEDIPFVIQYNKRDLPDALPIPALQAKLNTSNVQHFEAIATHGVGVFQTLDTITKMVLKSVLAKTRQAKQRV